MPLQEIFQSFLSSFFQIILLLINPVVLIPVIIVIVVLAKKNKEYKNTGSTRNGINKTGGGDFFNRFYRVETAGKQAAD